MDVSVRVTTKGTAKYDKPCELQNSAKQQNFECIWRFRLPLKACLFHCVLLNNVMAWACCCLNLHVSACCALMCVIYVLSVWQAAELNPRTHVLKYDLGATCNTHAHTLSNAAMACAAVLTTHEVKSASLLNLSI